MTRQFYNRFIRPISRDSDQAEREVVLNFLLVGIFMLAIIALVDTILAPLISGEPFYADRVIDNLIAIAFIGSLYALSRYKRKHREVAVVLTLLISLYACLMLYQWGLLLPAGILLSAMSIVMAGILISARSALYTAGGITLVLIVLQYAKAQNYIHPDTSWKNSTSTAGDVIGYTAMFFVIALISWLFNRQMELSLKRAQRSEKALQRQRDLLEIKVERRARQLEEAQLEKMQQLYRFAELGQLSTALFHDLADHLSTVNLDVGGLPDASNPDIARRIQRNVGHINDIVRRVRQQIGGKKHKEVFGVRSEVKEVTKILSLTADQAGIVLSTSIDPSVKSSLLLKGDVIRFRQVILNLITNAIEAYPGKRPKQAASRSVDIKLRRHETTLFISIADRGSGIPKGDKAKIFEPFYTTKNRGIGIGLFIVRQIIENDFGGSMEISENEPSGTVFTIGLPKSYYARAKKI